MDAGFGLITIASSQSRRRSALRTALLLSLPILVAGCLQMERTVKLDRDGSGVLIERLVPSSEIVSLMADMQPEGRALEIRDDEKLRADAASFGTSVHRVSVHDVVTEFGRGYKARYALDDVNLLHIGRNIEDSMPGDMAASDGPADGQPKFTTFTLRRTSSAELVVH